MRRQLFRVCVGCETRVKIVDELDGVPSLSASNLLSDFQGREKMFHATPEQRLRQGSSTNDMLDSLGMVKSIGSLSSRKEKRFSSKIEGYRVKQLEFLGSKYKRHELVESTPKGPTCRVLGKAA
ncbi:hypothetical protein TNCV_718851 [Trichonephila clavipes]|nr:hypothetical protein TNCV_718851 [Trichonephila clavipes]